MSKRLKAFLVIVSRLMMAGLVYIGGPFVGCWYNHYRFNRYVRVRIDISSCGGESSEPVLRTCRYIVSFEGAEEPEMFQFQGADLHLTYDSKKRTYMVEGAGRIENRNNVIELTTSNVLVNKQTIPQASQPVLVFVRSDGRLLSEYCDIS
jgi:hypothetical protein